MSLSTLVDNSTLTSGTNSTSANSAVYNVALGTDVSFQLNYTATTPAAKTFVAANVNVTPNTITITTNGFFTGLKVALTGTNLPGGLSATNYWVILVDANTISLATSLLNALAGTAIDITSQGTTSDATLTPASLSQVIKLQQSADGVTYFDVSGLTVTVTGTGNTLWAVSPVTTQYYQVVVTPTAGSMTYAVLVNLFNRGYSL